MRFSLSDLTEALANNPDLRAEINVQSDLTDAARQVTGTSEYILQKQIMDEVAIRALSNPAWHLVKVIPMGQGKPGKWSSAGMQHSAGQTDIFVYRAAHLFHGMAMELKVGNNQVSSVQDEWHSTLKQEGYYVCICRTFEDALTMLEWWLSWPSE